MDQIETLLIQLPKLPIKIHVDHEVNLVKWELEIWHEIFKNGITQNLKDKLITYFYDQNIFCYYVANNLESIINKIKKRIYNEFKNIDDNAYISFNDFEDNFRLNVNRLKSNIICESIKTNYSPIITSLLIGGQREIDRIGERISYELNRTNIIQPLKQLCINHFFKKIYIFYNNITYEHIILTKELYYIFKYIEVLSTKFSHDKHDKTEDIINANYLYLNDLFKPKIILKKWLDFFKNLNLPNFIFNNQSTIVDLEICDGSCSDESLSVFLLIFKECNYMGKQKNDIYCLDMDVFNIPKFVDKKYVSYIQNYLNIKNFGDLLINLESLLELNDLDLSKILFSFENPFIFLISGYTARLQHSRILYQTRIGKKFYTLEKREKPCIHSKCIKYIYNKELNILEEQTNIY